MTGTEIQAKQPQLWDIVKSKINLRVFLMEKQELDKGKLTYKKIDTNSIFMSGKEFRRELTKDFLNGIDHDIQIVNEEPKTFKMNQLFIRADGAVAWAYIEKD